MGKAVFIPYICALATSCKPPRLSPKTDFGEVGRGVSMSGAFGTFFFFFFFSDSGNHQQSAHHLRNE